ncbi:MAG: hypothetical protein JXA82_16305 [Sedimentisphaerales bacterium]|nr:hypothetical protein [Sedimentisphaerales bacterium]
MDRPDSQNRAFQAEPKNSYLKMDSGNQPINLITYLFILWRHKSLFLFCLFLPMALLGCKYFFSESKYHLYLRYDIRSWELTHEDASLLVDRFYANVTPSFIPGISEDEFSKVKVGVWPVVKSSPAYRPSQDNMAEFLEIAFSAESREHLEREMASLRGYFEQVVQLYSFRDFLLRQEMNWRSQINQLEQFLIDLEPQIEMQKELFERFSSMNSSDVELLEWAPAGGQFDLGQKTEFLPVSYHVRAVLIRIAELEEERRWKKSLCVRYDHMISVAHSLLETFQSIPSDYTLERLHNHLVEFLNAENDEAAVQFVNTFRRNVENRMTTFQLAVPGPVSLISLDRLRIGLLTFFGALIISVVVVLLWEGISSSLRERAEGS